MENLKEHPLYRKHTLDTVMSSLWEFYRKKFLVLFITSFILSVTTHLLMLNFNLTELQNFTDPMEVLEKVRGMILPIAIISVISLYFTVVLQYYVICNPVDRDITILSSTYKSLKYFLPYLIIIILLSFFGSIALALGLLVFIIGIFFAALYIATLYMFFLPVLIVEGTDIGNAIARTFSLVHKRFWINIGSVSYTHLRAHETVLDLVCRLLLEKKKQHDKNYRRRSQRFGTETITHRAHTQHDRE